MKKTSRWRKISRWLVLVSLCLILLTGIVAGVLYLLIMASVGKLPDEASYRAYEALPNFKDGQFANYEPMQHVIWKKPFHHRRAQSTGDANSAGQA